jgi:putative endopeptidase
MKRRGVIYLFAIGIVLFSALTIVAFGSSENSMGNTNTSVCENTFDPGSMNLSVKPGDDFYEYVNGGWIKSHPVPADKYRYGETEIVEDRTYDRIKGIVESAANNNSIPEGSLEKKIGDFYRVGMDNVTLDKQRLDKIKDELKMIDDISNTSDVQDVSTQMMEYGMDPFFSIYADADAKNSKIMIANLIQGGLSLPDKDTQDRDFYLRQDNESIKTREQYLAHVTEMFVLLGDSPKIAQDNAKTVLRIETRLAKASFSSVENTDEIKTYNKMSLKELQNLAPGINWSRLFSSLGRPEVAEVNVRNPSFFKELSKVLVDESVADWKIFLRWKLILATSPYLSSDLEREHFDFYEGKIKGQKEMQPRWRRVIDAENKAMGDP